MNQEGTTKKNQSMNNLVLLGLFFLLVFFVFGLIKEIVNRRQINRQLSNYNSKIESLKKENAELSQRIVSWDQGGGLEENARMKLGLQKPGEGTIIIVRTPESGSVQTAVKSNQQVITFDSSKLESDGESNPAKWRRYFFQ